MAQRKSKKTEAPKIDIGAEIFASLRELEKLKGISVDYMVERLKQAMANAYRKDREDHRDIPAENVVVDLSEEGRVTAECGKETITFEKSEVALVRLRVEF